MLIKEIETIKPLTPAQAKVKSLQDQVKRDQAAAKVAKANEKIAAGRKAIQKTLSQKSV